MPSFPVLPEFEGFLFSALEFKLQLVSLTPKQAEA